MGYINNIHNTEGYKVISGFGNTFVCDNAIDANKIITFPDGWNNDTNMSFKVIFKYGHNCADDQTHMTLNSIPIVINQYGTLIPLPIHEMDDSGTTKYKSLQPNTILEMYYTNDYDGNNNPAYVVIGNPIVLSSADYTIYADGSMKDCPPLGATYVQYPRTKSPAEIWFLATWEVLDYGGAFFRTEGGNALPFNASLEVSSQSGTTMVFTTAHNLNVGSPIYDAVNNECRLVASVTDTTTVELDSAFTYSNLTNVLIGQYDQMQHLHGSFVGMAGRYDSRTYQNVSVVDSGNLLKSGANTARNGFSNNATYSIPRIDIDNSIGARTGYDYESGQYIGADETRSINFTYKIWKRVN